MNRKAWNLEMVTLNTVQSGPICLRNTGLRRGSDIVWTPRAQRLELFGAVTANIQRSFCQAVQHINIQLDNVIYRALLTSWTSVLPHLQLFEIRNIWSTICYITVRRTWPSLEPEKVASSRYILRSDLRNLYGLLSGDSMHNEKWFILVPLKNWMPTAINEDGIPFHFIH